MGEVASEMYGDVKGIAFSIGNLNHGRGIKVLGAKHDIDPDKFPLSLLMFKIHVILTAKNGIVRFPSTHPTAPASPNL
jgi:hypothetical protein